MEKNKELEEFIVGIFTEYYVFMRAAFGADKIVATENIDSETSASIMNCKDIHLLSNTKRSMVLGNTTLFLLQLRHVEDYMNKHMPSMVISYESIDKFHGDVLEEMECAIGDINEA